MITFEVLRAERMKWEVLINSSSEYQYFHETGDMYHSYQLAPEASLFVPGPNVVTISVRRRCRGALKIQSIVLHAREKIGPAADDTTVAD